MNGIPLVFIGYELADDALDAYYPASNDPIHALITAHKSFLRYVERQTGCRASMVRYNDANDQTGIARIFICCFVDRSGRAYSTTELEGVAVPPGFLGVPSRVRTIGGLERVVCPSAFMISYDADGRPRVEDGAVIA